MLGFPRRARRGEFGRNGGIMRVYSTNALRGLAPAIIAIFAVFFGALGVVGAAGEASAQSEWLRYTNPQLGFQVLYPRRLAAKRLDLRPAEGTVVVEEWTREDSPARVRLTLIDKPAGLSLRDWINRENPGRFAETTIAGQPAYIVEAVFEGQLTTDVYLEDQKSGTVINFTHAVHGITDWAGKSVNRIKNRYRPQLTDFWNMVESIKFPQPEDE
jgi:hypothetical protein